MRLSQEWNVTHTSFTNVDVAYAYTHTHTLIHTNRTLSIVPITRILEGFFLGWLLFINAPGKEHISASSVREQ